MRTLVLNKNYIPIKFISHYTAIGKVFCGKAFPITVIDNQMIEMTWTKWAEASLENFNWNKDQFFIEGVSQRFAIPLIIRSATYAKIPSPGIRLSRKAVLERDHYSCYICGNTFSGNALTIDHIIPKSRNGRSEWENLATCCKKCNDMKADKLLSELKIKPQFEIIRPKISNIQKLKMIVREEKHIEWQYFGI